MSQENNTQAAIDAGRPSRPAAVHLSHRRCSVYLVGRTGEVISLVTFMAESEKRQPTRAASVAPLFTELASFIEHVNRLRDDKSAIFHGEERADRRTTTTATPPRPRWGSTARPTRRRSAASGVSGPPTATGR